MCGWCALGWRERERERSGSGCSVKGRRERPVLTYIVPQLDQDMANGAERVQRLTREAFHRLRNDHEQFLDAYESEFFGGLWII